MSWFLENWQAIVGTGTVTTIINYLINKQQQKQQLRAGNIDNEIKEAEQGLKEVELLKETITVYKDVNADLKSDLSEAKEIIKEFKIKDKRYEELEKKVNDLYTQLAIETEKSKFLIEENTELNQKYGKLEKDYEDLKLFCEKLKRELETHKRTTK
jgi:DNA repair exonuclease SbcCD ATPase subunit